MERKTIISNGREYVIENNNGRINLLEFNKKHKMWIKCFFSQENLPNSIKEVLSNQYIENHIDTSYTNEAAIELTQIKIS